MSVNTFVANALVKKLMAHNTPPAMATGRDPNFCTRSDEIGPVPYYDAEKDKRILSKVSFRSPLGLHFRATNLLVNDANPVIRDITNDVYPLLSLNSSSKRV